MKLFDNAFGTLEKALELRFKRHTILSSNIANSETPNFRARDLDFSGELSRALDGRSSSPLIKTNRLHMDIGGAEQARIVFDQQGAMGADGNNVDIDLSMGKLAENSGAFETTANYLMLKLRSLRAATRSGGGE